MKQNKRDSSHLDNEKKKKSITSDTRFANLYENPRFKHASRKKQKVSIDKRFHGMFSHPDFNLSTKKDEKGGNVSKSMNNYDMKSYYDAGSSDDEEEEEIEGNDTLDKESIPLKEGVKAKLNNLEVDFARGEAALFSDGSSSDEESSDEEGDDGPEANFWEVMDADAETTEESTTRLALCNMDWDRISAQDIMVLCSSFTPPGGLIKSVTVYPSQFGKERMAEEEISGPKELIDTKIDDEEEEEEGEDEQTNEEYQAEKLRQYQLSRLKYYYAVIECDSISTAEKLYRECDGLEYESTANKMDLRFIPDEMTFDEDTPRDTSTILPDLKKYKPREYVTKALQQGKLELTWDENDIKRKDISEKLRNSKLEDIADDELQQFVALGSSASESDSESEGEHEKSKKKLSDTSKNTVNKYRQLLQEAQNKKKLQNTDEIENEFTWDVAVGNKNEQEEEEEEEESDESQSEEEEEEEPSEAEESKAESEPENNDAELALLLDAENSEEKGSKKKKKRGKNKFNKKPQKDDDFVPNLEDSRFKNIHSNVDFHRDPSNAHFKKVQTMQKKRSR